MLDMVLMCKSIQGAMRMVIMPSGRDWKEGLMTAS